MQVEKYEVKYISLGAMSEQQQRTLDPSEMAEDGTLVIEDFPGAADKAMRLEARILYSDGVFSPWISSKEPVSDHAPPPSHEEKLQKYQSESLSSWAVTGLSCSSRGESNDRNFPTAAKKQVTFDSHQRVPGQFILIN